MEESVSVSHREGSAERPHSGKPLAQGLARGGQAVLGLAHSLCKAPFPHLERSPMRAPASEGGGVRQTELSTAAGTEQVLVRQQLTLMEGLAMPGTVPGSSTLASCHSLYTRSHSPCHSDVQMSPGSYQGSELCLRGWSPEFPWQPPSPASRAS